MYYDMDDIEHCKILKLTHCFVLTILENIKKLLIFSVKHNIETKNTKKLFRFLSDTYIQCL